MSAPELVYDRDGVAVWFGDNRDVLAGMPAGSVDAVVTDPPYGAEFMVDDEWAALAAPVQASTAARTGRDHLGTGAAIRESSTLPGFTTGAPPIYGGDRPRTNRCVSCGKRHQFRNAHGCAGGWLSEPISDDGPPPGAEALQTWARSWARACWRVLKPGGYLVAFGAPRTYHRVAAGIEDAGFDVRDSLHWIQSQGFPKGAGLSAAGDQWAGWHTHLKPAHEPIVLARRPPLGSTVANVEREGVGGLNVEGCRVPAGAAGETATDSSPGRWPPNVLLGAEAAAELAGAVGEGAAAFPVFRYEPKARGDERPVVGGVAHPTVKPLGLMQWLVRLVAPAGAVVLDPCAGTGTTGRAAMVEGRRAVLIERDQRYVPLIEARLAAPLQVGLW